MGLLDNLSDVLGENGTVQGVVVNGGRGSEASLVGGSTKGNHLILVVLEQDSNVNVTLIGDGVLNEVLTIIMIGDFTGDLETIFGLDVDLEGVTSGLSVLAFIVTGLDDELNWLADGLILEDTWSKGKRLVSARVKEVGVVNVSGG